ncbi:MAG: zinc ribbon domain-containing protein [Dehalococcoidia bacterium]|jgi:hypothetical protein|nr:zinc ribbon domain-containing protein [Dehalococcoidia bacterium]
MATREYSCDKCGAKNYQAGELRTTGSGLSRYLNLQNQKYATVACIECGFTELYRLDGGSRAASVLDIFTN